MLLRERHGVQAQSCAYCGGLWLPDQSWRKIRGLAGWQHEGSTALRPARNTSRRNCPACDGQRLYVLQLRAIEIDVCPRCDGVWLDRDELRRLLGLPKQTLSLPSDRMRLQTDSGRDGWVADAIGSAGETGLEVVLEILGCLLID
jgi:Zn-finger nucleic acid-binding protein